MSTATAEPTTATELTTQAHWLKSAMDHLSRVSGRKTALPILGTTKLAYGPDLLELTATDLESTLVRRIPLGESSPPGDHLAVCIPTDRLAAVAAAITGASVTLRLAKTVGIASGSVRADLPVLDAAEFPAIPHDPDARTYPVNGQTLRDVLGAVLHAAATDDSRPVLAGIDLRIDGGLWRGAAADGFRLAVKHGHAAEGEPVRAILPARSVKTLLTLIGDYSGAVTVGFGANAVTFDWADGAYWFSSRVIDGTFPDVAQIIPKAAAGTITADRAELLHAARAIKPFAVDVNDALLLRPGEHLLTLTTRGEASLTIDTEADLTGEQIEVAVNCHYLIDCLTAIGGQRVTIALNGPNQAAVIRPESTTGFVEVIMPMVIGA